MKKENRERAPVTVRSRQYFAGLHLASAVELARRAYVIETRGDISQQPEHRALIVGCLMTVVAFLEAAINEFVEDISDPHMFGNIRLTTAHFTEKERDRFRRVLRLEAKLSCRRKYDIVLAVLDKPPIDSGRTPAQDLEMLTRLRNMLVHFVPKWQLHDGFREFDEPFARAFPHNKLVHPGTTLYFPSLCLGYGCAHWAITKSRAFVDEFAAHLNLQDNPWYVTTPDPIKEIPHPS
jgi:hypothetical protein